MILSKSRCKVSSGVIRYIQLLQAYFTYFYIQPLGLKIEIVCSKNLSPKSRFTQKPINWFAMQINLLVSIRYEFPLVSIWFFSVISAFRQILLADFIILFHVKENLKDVFNRASFRFHFLDFRLKLPLLFNESISGHLNVKEFSVSFATLSCGLRLSSITHNFYSLARNMGIATVTNVCRPMGIATVTNVCCSMGIAIVTNVCTFLLY